MRNFTCLLELPACCISVLLAVSLCWGSTFCDRQTPHLICLGCSTYLYLEGIGASVLGSDQGSSEGSEHSYPCCWAFLGLFWAPFLWSSRLPKALRVTCTYQQNVPSNFWTSSVAPSWPSFIYLPKAPIHLHSWKRPCIKVSSQFEVTCVMLLDTQALSRVIARLSWFPFPVCPAVQNCLAFVRLSWSFCCFSCVSRSNRTVYCLLQQSQLISLDFFPFSSFQTCCRARERLSPALCLEKECFS